MAALTEWLQIMLAEIARKREDLEQARAEEARRASEAPHAGGDASRSDPPPPSSPSSEVRSLQEARAARR
jgi:hypothetical protein